MNQLTEYVYPNSLQEVLTLVNDKETAVIAGGTQLIPLKYKSIKRLVDLRHIGLNYISKDNNLVHIGSTSTITDMIESLIIQKIGKGVLTKACLLIADTPLRNVITIGGNIANPTPWAGLPVALLILNAQVVIVKKNTTDLKVPIQEFIETGGIKRGVIIKEVIIPMNNEIYCRYEKFSLTNTDYTWLTLGFSTFLDNGNIINPCVAVSRITKSQRLVKVEKFLNNKNIDSLDFNEITSILTESTNIRADYRSSKEYRTRLLCCLFKRMLKDIREEARDK